MDANQIVHTNESEIEGIEIRRQGTTGYVTVKRLVDVEATGSKQAIVIIAEVPPHQKEGIPPHFHRRYEETMYVAGGKGIFRVGESPDSMREIPIQTGDCCYVPADSFHAVEVQGDETLKLVCSYFCSSGEGGKSHRQISVELTNLPMQGAYGTAPQS